MMTGLRIFADKLMDRIEKSDDRIFFFLFSLFVLSNTIFMLGWKPAAYTVAWKVFVGMFCFVMWSCAIWFFYVVAEALEAWKRIWVLGLTGAVIFLATALVSRTLNKYTYAGIMGMFFCLMVCGKDYRRVLKLFLVLIASTLVFAFFGWLCGFTSDAAKPDVDFGGHSYGIIYPNNWGFLVFDVLVLVWYLFLREKKILTVILFWAAAVFMVKVITCKTIALLAAVFPLAGMLAEWVEQRENTHVLNNGKKSSGKLLRRIVIALPFVFFAFMLFLCWQMDWVRDMFYQTPLKTMAMRFVEGGYALRLNGVTLFGGEFGQMQEGIVEYTKEIDMKVDSAYVAYLIIRGVIPVLVTLLWMSVAHGRCLKNRDYRLLTISVFMLLFSVMERPGFDVWYNFVLLYPLAKIPLTRK